MSNGWTRERRAQQAAQIHRWKPWAHATGPRSPEGKAQAARNAQRFHGWTPELLALRAEVQALCATSRDLLRQQDDTRTELLRVLAGRG